jgi:hypothetical protein
MRNLAKNTVYVVIIHKGADSFNTYSKIANAYKITNGKRTYLNTDNEKASYHTGDKQEASEYLKKIGFKAEDRLPENVVVSSHNVKYRTL